jgi:hypothetical protein
LRCVPHTKTSGVSLATRRDRMPDEWTFDSLRVTDPEVLSRLRKTVEDVSDLVVEHRFYRAARSPFRFICSDIEQLEQYLRSEVSPGDSFFFWKFEDCCVDDNVKRGKSRTLMAESLPAARTDVGRRD